MKERFDVSSPELRRKDSAFPVALINDSEISADASFVIFVHNKSEVRPDGGGKKPAGRGLPGGGVNRNDIEGGVQREFESETGLKSDNVVILSRQQKAHIFDESWQSKETSVNLKPGEAVWLEEDERALIWTGYICSVVPVWDGSRLQEIFRNFKRKLVEGGTVEQQLIDSCGIELPLGSLTETELASLNIGEIDEVDAICLLPTSYVVHLAGLKTLPEGFYKSHVRNAAKVIETTMATHK